MSKATDDEQVVVLQPEYFAKFQCDGTKCDSLCCSLNWKIEFDYATYQEYCAIKDKQKRQSIVKHLKYQKEKNNFLVDRAGSSNGACSMLGAGSLCRIQKEYGEDYLPLTCLLYPRIMNLFDNLIERSLSLSCPVAAKLILLPSEPMAFEQISVPKDRKVKHFQKIYLPDTLPIAAYFFDVQYACISILQNRTFTIDERLVIMGFFLSQVTDAVADNRPEQLENLVNAYTSDDFATQLPALIEMLEFNPREYMRSIMEDVLDNLYGKDARFHHNHKIQMGVLSKFFGFSDKIVTVPLDTLADKYENELRVHKRKMFDKYSHIWENFLVNEFFLETYPFNVFPGDFISGYKLFVTMSKVFELIVLLMLLEDEENGEEVLVNNIIALSVQSEHNRKYLATMSKSVVGKNADIINFMNTFLDVRKG